MKRIICLVLLTCLLAPPVLCAYPPENAAVLYYKNMEHFAKPDSDAIWDELCDLRTSDTPASDAAKEYLAKNSRLIEELQTASELKQCDWGLDYSKGFDMLMPGLASMKKFHYILLADSAIRASEGNITEALEKNLTTRRMGQHITNDTLIGFLVSFSINRSSDVTLTHLLGTYRIDEETLIDLKNELLWQTYHPKTIRHPLMMEKEICLQEISIMTPQRLRKTMGDWDCKEEDKTNHRLLELLEQNDPAFRNQSAAYLKKHYDEIFAITEKPYSKAYTEIGTVTEKIVKDATNGKDEALFAAIFCPALAKCYNHGILWKTHYNATLTALDIYITAAKTGKLPEKLPSTTYPDHFSGKPFIYEPTDDGFTLKCGHRDLVKNITHEFTFKLPK